MSRVQWTEFSSVTSPTQALRFIVIVVVLLTEKRTCQVHIQHFMYVGAGMYTNALSRTARGRTRPHSVCGTMRLVYPTLFRQVHISCTLLRCSLCYARKSHRVLPVVMAGLRNVRTCLTKQGTPHFRDPQTWYNMIWYLCASKILWVESCLLARMRKYLRTN